MTTRNFFFLFGQIAFHFNQFHSVEQRPGNRVQIVCRGNEQHLRQIIVKVQEVIVERVVLLGVKHFQQGRLRVAIVIILRNLVDFIQNEHWIVCLGFDETFDDAARHRPDIRAAVAANLGFIVNTSQGYSDIFPAQSGCYAFSQRGLAHSRRTIKAQYRGLHILADTQNGQMLQNALLDLLHSVVVAV